jgi:hypothetical protein
VIGARVSLLAILLAASALGQAPLTLTDDGAWCWFADPRAVYHAGTHRRTYLGWVTRRGDIVVAHHDHGSGKTESSVLHPGLDRDDHANPALLVREDGRIDAYYTRHAGRKMYVRTSLRKEDATAWGPERTFAPNTGKWGRDGYCYPNPVRLAAESGRRYLFWRGDHWKPTLSRSDDGGRSWSAGRIVLMRKGAGAGSRPYVKVDTDGESRIHLAFTDGHPRNEKTNSIYYAAYDRGAFHRADGKKIVAIDALPFQPRQADCVYDGRQTGVRAWIWDVAVDADGRPVIVYARLPAESDHRYHYARWTGKRWDDHELCAAGGWFPTTAAGKREREPHYSGGVVLDHDDPTVVYLSRPIDGVFEIERWSTADGGETWSHASITSGSKHHNVRPVVVRGHASRPGFRVAWMELAGGYEHYTRFHAAIRAR